MSEVIRWSSGEPEAAEGKDQIPVIPRVAAQNARPMGTPLSVGSSARQQHSAQHGDPNRLASAPAPSRSLAAPASSDDSSGIARAVSMFRTVAPIVQRILPLLDGNFATAIGNLIAPRPHPQAAPPPKVDLAPIESNLVELQTQHRNLHEQVMEQNSSLKRVQDQLEMVREATDRNTLEQQELLEDLKTFSGKLKVIAVVGISLLAVGFILELLMFFHLQRVLP
jgi:hypothetical protein